MQRFIEFTLLFSGVILLQVFFFNNLNLTPYIYPMVYLAFIIFLPMELSHISVLMLGLLTGVTTDLMLGSAGMNTIAVLFISFCRPAVLAFFVGKDMVRDGGLPLPSKIGAGKYTRYALIMIAAHCSIFFSLESLSWKFFHLTALKIICSTVVTFCFVYLIQMLIPAGNAAGTRQ